MDAVRLTGEQRARLVDLLSRAEGVLAMEPVGGQWSHDAAAKRWQARRDLAAGRRWLSGERSSGKEGEA